MAFKLILTGLSSFSVGVVVGILIIYFLCGRKFFSFMKVERSNICGEMNSNTKEVLSEVDRRAFLDQPEHKLLEEKEENSDEKE